MEALKLLKEGNERFVVGSSISGKVIPDMRWALVKEGQSPHTAEPNICVFHGVTDAAV